MDEPGQGRVAPNAGGAIQALAPARSNGGSIVSSSSETVAGTIQAFRQDLGIRRSTHTVEAYTTALRHFENFCGEVHQPAVEMPIAAVTPDMALSFVRWLQANKPVSPTTLDK